MSVDALRPQDAALWCVQQADTPLHIGAVCLFDGAPLRAADGSLRIEDFRLRVASRLPTAPRFRRRLQALPFDQGLIWVDDDTFTIDRHVRAGTIPAPGTEAELRARVARLLEEPLDPTRPLWEIWVLDGLADGRVAVVPKVSHVLADGMALLEFALTLLDPAEPQAEPDESAPPWRPTPGPGPLDVLAHTAARARAQLASIGHLGSALLDPARVGRLATSLARVVRSGGGAGSGLAPALPVTSPVAARRDVAWTALPWAGLEQVARREGVTLNDVVLTVAAGGLGRYLDRRGATPGDRAPRVLVPVSTHGRNAENEIENRFSMLVADLPVGAGDPLRRLRHVHEEMQRHKASAQGSVAPALFELASLVPVTLLRLAGPSVLRHQPFANLAVTNLPGTREPAYLLGARLEELYPYIGVIGNIAVIVGVVSYRDAIGVGVTVDAGVVPDVEALVDDIAAAGAELIATSGDG